jgi:hypothetical protein
MSSMQDSAALLAQILRVSVRDVGADIIDGRPMGVAAFVALGLTIVEPRVQLGHD